MSQNEVEEIMDRRSILVTLRDRLLIELSESGGHEPGCLCSCDAPVPSDGRVLSALSKELRAVIAELDAMPDAKEVSVSADLRARIEKAWGTTA